MRFFSQFLPWTLDVRRCSTIVRVGVCGAAIRPLNKRVQRIRGGWGVTAGMATNAIIFCLQSDFVDQVIECPKSKNTV